MLKRILLLAFLLLFVYFIPKQVPLQTPQLPPSVSGYGAAWFEANATIAYAKVRSHDAVEVEGLLFPEPVPEKILVWTVSDQQFFTGFAERLEDALKKNGAVVERTASPSGSPAVLVAANSKPPDNLRQLLEKGWVLVYVGRQFAENFTEFDFTPRDALKSEYDISAYKTSFYKTGQWQSVKTLNGFVALHEKSLDQSWQTPEKAAEEVSSFVLNASWMKPSAFFKGKGNGTFFSTPFADEAASGFVSMAGENVSRFFFSVRRPQLRVWTPSSVVWPSNFPISFENNAGELRVCADDSCQAALAFINPSQFVSTSLSSEKLEGGPHVISIKDSRNRTISSSFLLVRKLSVSILSSDFATKTFYAEFRSDGEPLRFQTVELNGTLFYTDGEGVAKFRDSGAMEGENKYVFRVQDVAVSTSVNFNPPLFSVSTISLVLAAVFAVLAFLFSGKIGKTFVFFHLPEKRALKTIRLSQESMKQFDGMTLEEIKHCLCSKDPLLRIDDHSLDEALESAVKKKWLERKGEVFCSPKH
ncbi:hypothetical protein HZC09_00280 [Candidatus Micrarchaeota archaeon]|nr:hypothetical protein [Candidatus Micrarchaeota archaeon]